MASNARQYYYTEFSRQLPGSFQIYPPLKEQEGEHRFSGQLSFRTSILNCIQVSHRYSLINALH